MRHVSKKERELFWLESLKAKLPEITDASVESSESPDFVLSSRGRALGVEVTEICEPLAEAQDSLQWRVCDEAIGRCRCRSATPVAVFVNFAPKPPLRKKRVSTMACQLGELISDNIPEQCPGSSEVERARYSDAAFPSEISRVSVLRSPSLTRSTCSPVSAVFVPTCDAQYVQSRIDSHKDDALAQGCSEVWLLVVVDGFSLGRMATISDSALSATYLTPFDRVYLLHDRDTLYQLNVVDQSPQVEE